MTNMSTPSPLTEDSSDDEPKSPSLRRPPRSKYIFSYGRALEPKFSNPSLAGYYRPWRFTDKRYSGVSKVFYARTREFRIAMDVSQFSHENIVVKVIDNFVVVEGRHDRQEDHLGSIRRQFTRKYKAPPDVKLNTIHGKYKKGILFLWGDRVLEQVEKSDVAEVEEKPKTDSIVSKHNKRHQLHGRDVKPDPLKDKNHKTSNQQQIVISIEYSPGSS